MIQYLPSPAGETMSRALWSLSRPAGIWQAGDTQYLFPLVEALDKTWWLEVDPEHVLNIHKRADYAPIAQMLDLVIAAGDLPPDTNEFLSAVVEANRGGSIKFIDALPESLKSKLQTQEQMELAGRLNKTEVLL